jgi:hypothetical protein
MSGRLGQERLNQSPFSICQISLVAQSNAAILPPIGRGPHGRSKLPR